MRRLLDFLYKYRELGLFLILETLSIWLIIGYNRRYNASFFNSSNEWVASIEQQAALASDYLQLSQANERLRSENERLKQELLFLTQPSVGEADTTQHFVVTAAKVIRNTYRRPINFMTIKGGENRNVQPGMAVIGAEGIVGQVKSVSENFATVYSLLHPNLLVSSTIKRTRTQATVQWDQAHYDRASLKYIPRHVQIKQGDTVVTSGYNSVFPPDVLVGTVEAYSVSDEDTFYEATLKLATDFTSLSHVYVIRDVLKQEKDSLLLP